MKGTVTVLNKAEGEVLYSTKIIQCLVSLLSFAYVQNAWSPSGLARRGGLRPCVPLAARVLVGVQLVVGASAQHQLVMEKRNHRTFNAKDADGSGGAT